VCMSGNCQKPAFSVAKTGSSGTPLQTSRPCGRWVIGGFSGATNYIGGVRDANDTWWQGWTCGLTADRPC
ncbi:hypothetical protein, partial [Xanthomonas campestris]|uniref:hypothetical protein n=1 Tax=Xanthomonas campestris TaxID=339 RepID=UPI0039C3AB89